MSTNTGQIPGVYPTTTGVPTSPAPNYSTQQPNYGQDQKYNYQPPQQPQPQHPQQVFGGQQFGGMVPPPTTTASQQPQFQQMYPGNPVMSQNYYPPVVVVQQAPVPILYPQQPMYGQFPTSIPAGGLTSGPGLVDCPRCGKRGLTNTNPVAGATTHLWALLCCFCLCLGCIPYLLSDLKDVEHNCSSCGAHVATWRR